MAKKISRVPNKKKLGNKNRKQIEPKFELHTHKKNEFWKARSKSGRDTIFKTGEDMLDAAEEYAQWCEDNPLYKSEWKDKGLEEIPLRRPYTLIGFCLFCGVNSVYFAQFKKSSAGKKGDFPKVIATIEEMIYNQKYEGAAVGHFKENLIARDLQLHDAQAIAHTGIPDKTITQVEILKTVIKDATK